MLFIASKRFSRIMVSHPKKALTIIPPKNPIIANSLLSPLYVSLRERSELNAAIRHPNEINIDEINASPRPIIV
jgi:hypothetical protein